jgi:hypothetical protein
VSYPEGVKKEEAAPTPNESNKEDTNKDTAKSETKNLVTDSENPVVNDSLHSNMADLKLNDEENKS